MAWVDKERQPKLISPTFDEGWVGNGKWSEKKRSEFLCFVRYPKSAAAYAPDVANGSLKNGHHNVGVKKKRDRLF